MQDAYGEFLTGDRYTLKNAVTEADMVWIPEVEKFQNYRSVQCCALLAALNIEFETASQCSSKFKVRAAVSKNRKNSLSSAAPSVSNSRAFLLQRASENRWISSGDNGALHYWNVRLRDSSWLRRHFPHSHAFPAAPTVNADRASIRQLLKRPYASRGTKTDLIKPAIRSRAGVRARIRDSIWLSDYCAKLSQNACLDERRQEVEQPGPSSARTNAKRYQTAQTAVIRDALRSALAADGFPAAISYAELGNRARLSVAMIKVTLKFDHELSQQVRSARLALPQRRVVWAVQELRSMNRTPSTSAVMRLAHVKRSKSMRALIQRSLEDKLEK
ncbi:hypothetical protein WN982_25940 [Paraburkholderia sp. IMGN_8]|uniref:hypothetical protein n=1 Tax=Paraburkholderia sp. IMGN_8 TaxID=3136564 RepID=UPI0031014814